jgi:hypothetical protein
MTNEASRLVGAGVVIVGTAFVLIIFGMIIETWLQASFTLFAELNTPLAWVIYGIILGTAVGHEAKEIYAGGVVFSAVVAILAILMGQLDILAVAALPWIAYVVYGSLQSR